MRNGIAKYVYCDITKGKDIFGISIVMSQWVMMLLSVHHSAWWRCNNPLSLSITTPTYDIAVSPVNSLKLYI